MAMLLYQHVREVYNAGMLLCTAASVYTHNVNKIWCYLTYPPRLAYTSLTWNVYANSISMLGSKSA